MVQKVTGPDPFEALIAQGVTAAGPDPSALPTVIEVFEAEAPVAAEPPPVAAEPEPEVHLPPPWWKSRLVVAGAAAAVLALTGVLASALWPEAAIPAPPVIVVMPRPAAVEARDDEPVPLPAPAPTKKTVRARSSGFAQWPGDKRAPAQAPPKDAEPLKRPSF